MMRAIQETNRRRALQQAYNEEHHITPKTVRSAIRELMEVTRAVDESADKSRQTVKKSKWQSKRWRSECWKRANNLDFEKAAKLRDQMLALKGEKVMASGEKSRKTRRKGR